MINVMQNFFSHLETFYIFDTLHYADVDPWRAFELWGYQVFVLRIWGKSIVGEGHYHISNAVVDWGEL
jgi:hypothetical protein